MFKAVLLYTGLTDKTIIELSDPTSKKATALVQQSLPHCLLFYGFILISFGNLTGALGTSFCSLLITSEE